MHHRKAKAPSRQRRNPVTSSASQPLPDREPPTTRLRSQQPGTSSAASSNAVPRNKATVDTQSSRETDHEHNNIKAGNNLTPTSATHRRRDSVVKSTTSSDTGHERNVLPNRILTYESRSSTESRREPAASFLSRNVHTPPRSASTASYPLDPWTIAGGESPRVPENDDGSLIVTPITSNDSSARPTSGSEDGRYISRVGDPLPSRLDIPFSPGKGRSPALSIISDAGEQQQLHQRSTLTQGRNSLSEDLDLAQSLHCLSVDDSKYELQQEIMNALVQTRSNSGHEQEFLPRGQLCRLINRESVFRELEKAFSGTHTQKVIEEYADAVCKETKVTRRGKEKIKSFRKMFALLVMADKSKSISLFLEEDVSDLDLPLVKRQGSKGNAGLYRRDAFGNLPESPLKCFRTWAPFPLRDFEKNQWMMLAPFFSPDKDGDVKHYLLQNSHILPFISPTEMDFHVHDVLGGYGKVSMIQIHADHHNFQDPLLCKRGFAIKQLYENDRGENDLAAFEKEVRILKKFSGARSHEHVVSLLATYEHLGRYHFIFYRAEGDLFKYWKEIMPRPDFRYSNVIWMAKQCLGMTDGLLRLHRHMTSTMRQVEPDDEPVQSPTSKRRVKFEDDLTRPPSDTLRSDGAKFGRHGDINPSNILCYHDSPEGDIIQGTLKISDFGQAELNSFWSRTGPRSVANTITYRPPECDLQPRIIRQSYDIWCLGCVYLEFAAWLLGGNQLREKFSRRRLAPDVFQNNHKTDTFFQIVRDQETDSPEVMIKPVVTRFIDELHKRFNCSDFFHDFLDMIQNNMLVEDSKDRMSCEEIRKSLDNMYKKCLAEEKYAVAKNPWHIRSEPPPRPVKVQMTPEAKRKIAESLSRRTTRSNRRKKCRCTNQCSC